MYSLVTWIVLATCFHDDVVASCRVTRLSLFSSKSTPPGKFPHTDIDN